MAEQDQNLLSDALTSIPYGFSLWDEHLRSVMFNDTYLSMYHLSPTRMRPGLTLHEVAACAADSGNYGELSIEAIYALYEERFLGGDRVKVVEHTVRDRVIRTTNTRMPDRGWVLTHQDITAEAAARRLAAAREQDLALQNMRFNAAVSNMPQGLCMFGPDLRLVICNEMFAAMYHLPPRLASVGTPFAEIVNYRVSQGWVPDDERGDYLLSRLTPAQEPGQATSFIEREHGRIISVMRQPMADGGWVSTHQDITEQRQKEELIEARKLELEIQNVRFNAAINNMAHGLSMFDAENRLIVCNRQFAEMYRLSEELTRPGTPFWAILDESARTGMVSIADRETRFQVLSRVIDAGLPLKDNVKMESGRVIAILHQPMAGGGWISTHENVTEQHHHEERIRHLARHDALTDLPNRVLFQEEMSKIEARIRRQEIVAVLCIDLDHFKAVNDGLGHAIGDAVLMTVARRLREAARETDVVARLGGDEFAILVGPLDDPGHAAIIAERVIKAMALPILVNDNEVMIGASIGIAAAPIDGTDAETLLRNADLALYRAKSEGRGAFHFFEQGMDDALKHRRSLEVGLKSALASGEFRLVFQPLLNLADNRICCLEALLRWDHPERGLISPSEFIPVAEDTGVIVEIGEWVLLEACRAATRWPESVRVAVNLSATQFRRGGLIDSVARALSETGLSPGRLEVEITESLLFTDTEATLKTLHAMRSMGVRVAMDDFGTGYSSLSQLRSFPFDKVKIDRSFMNGLSSEGESDAIVNAMIGLARSLGMATTAEGIETIEQLEAVRRYGYTEVQGFLFSAPLPASGVDALLGPVRVDEERRQVG